MTAKPTETGSSVSAAQERKPIIHELAGFRSSFYKDISKTMQTTSTRGGSGTAVLAQTHSHAPKKPSN
eukprot:2165810-Amphidinium_carterae.1